MPGSWMAQTRGPGELLCGNTACQKLWEQDWLAMRKAFASFDDMKALECDVCRATRADRCRVRQSEQDDQRHAQPPFNEAPYVVPYNTPKYFAQQLRAMQFELHSIVHIPREAKRALTANSDKIFIPRRFTYPISSVQLFDKTTKWTKTALLCCHRITKWCGTTANSDRNCFAVLS